jgi:hypothetical protein
LSTFQAGEDTRIRTIQWFPAAHEEPVVQRGVVVEVGLKLRPLDFQTGIPTFPILFSPHLIPGVTSPVLTVLRRQWLACRTTNKKRLFVLFA